MKFNDEEIQEALRKGMKISPSLPQDVLFFLDQDKLKVTYIPTNITTFSNYFYNELMEMDWQIIEEPEYEYLWVIEYGINNPKRRITTDYYKSKKDVNKVHTKSKILERCEWSKRKINNES